MVALSCAPARPSSSAVVMAFADGQAFPACSAFAVGPRGLVTAAHCLPGARLGDAIEYVSHDAWTRTAGGYALADVAYVDQSRDYAVLRTRAADAELVPLAIARAPAVAGAIVCARPAPPFALACGAIVERVGAYLRTTIDVRPGWSGAPVTDASGLVVGLVTACESAELADARVRGRGACLARTGVVADLTDATP